MIILLGPDSSGKTTLAQKLTEHGCSIIHSTAQTEYDSYMELLSGPKTRPIPLGAFPFYPGPLLYPNTNYVLDRWFWCEFPYSEILRKSKIRWSLKQLHNLHLATIAHNPVVILMTRQGESPSDESVPRELFLPILDSYKKWLDELEVTYIQWDYLSPPMSVDQLASHSLARQSEVIWWRNLAKKGIAGYGNTIYPTVMVLAEVLGGNNIYHYPFEQGPSGYYLSELVDETGIPLSSFYITNWKKTLNREENEAYLKKELFKTGVSSVLILGAVARDEAGSIIRSTGIPEKSIHTIKHPGWVVNHSETPREEQFRKVNYKKEWEEVWKKALTLSSLDGDTEQSREEDSPSPVIWVE